MGQILRAISLGPTGIKRSQCLLLLSSKNYTGFPGGSYGKDSASSAGDLGSIPGLRRSPGEGKGYPLQYSGLENSVDYIIHGSDRELDTTEQLSF